MGNNQTINGVKFTTENLKREHKKILRVFFTEMISPKFSPNAKGRGPPEENRTFSEKGLLRGP